MFTRRIFPILLFLAAFVSFLTAQNTAIVPDPPIGKGVTVIKAARLIDGTGKAIIRNAVVVVTDNMITAVGSSQTVKTPAGAKVIDLGDVTLLPGFIDAHTHVIGRILGDPAGNDAAVKDYDSFAAMSLCCPVSLTPIRTL